jgi:hypothetical protein
MIHDFRYFKSHYIEDLELRFIELSMVVHTVIPVLRRLRQDDCKFKDNLGYMVSSRQV